MTADLIDAIHRLRPGCSFALRDDKVIEWNHPDPPPATAEIEAEAARFEAEQARAEEFRRADQDYIRVVEDLVDVLVAKGVISLSDLPEAAQEKHQGRKTLRG